MACKLCKGEKPLRNSHVFPEWLYKPLYDEKHRFLILSTNVSKRRSTCPTGIYDKLFCNECEMRLSKWEGYARDIFYGLPLKSIEDNRKDIFSEVQYTPFKLFQISLFWRASLTNRPEVHKIDLGHHAERIRKMLLEDRPGELYEYGSILMLPPFDQKIMQSFIYSPECLPIKLGGHRAYRAFFGGLFWVFIVSNHSARFPHKEGFLSQDGQLPVLKVGGPALRFMQRLASDFLRVGMLDEPG